MRLNLRGPAASSAFALGAAALAYGASELLAMRRFRARKRPAKPSRAPGITILKPLHGDEPQLYENLRSFCEQDYPQYQVIFGARDPDDPALSAARRVAQEFPAADISIVADGTAVARNPKIANLLGMIGLAKHEIVIISDCDIQVGGDYLREIASCFEDQTVGAVTGLYAAEPIAGIASKASAIMLNEHFMPSVLVAMTIEPLSYMFGSTMAVRRDVLDRVGGLQALGDSIADDFMLGQKVAEAGYKVAMSPHLVQMSVFDPDFKEMWLHHVRWQRTVLCARPLGFIGSVVTYIVPMTLLYALLARRRALAGFMAGAALALRAFVHVESAKTFPSGKGLPVWLVPVADAIDFGTWLASFFNPRVSWRNKTYTVQGGGRLER